MGHHRTQNRRARAHKNAVWRPHSRPPRSADDDTARPIQKTVSEAVRLLVVRVRARQPVVRRFARAPRLRRAAARVSSRRPRCARLAPLWARADADAAADHARGRGGRAAARTKLTRRRRRRRIRLTDKPVDLARAWRGALSATERDELKQSTTEGKARTRKKISPHQCLL